MQEGYYLPNSYLEQMDHFHYKKKNITGAREITQYPHGGSQSPIIPVSRDPMPSLTLYIQAGMHST